MDRNRRYFFPITGYNFRLTNVACAMLCAQLERRNQILDRRHEIFRLYRELLSDVPGIGFQPVASWATLSPWLFCITVDEDGFGCSREDLMRELAECGIDTRPFFIPLHRLPPYEETWRKREAPLPVTDDLGQRGINLPTYTALSDTQITRVCDGIKQVHETAAAGAH